MYSPDKDDECNKPRTPRLASELAEVSDPKFPAGSTVRTKAIKTFVAAGKPVTVLGTHTQGGQRYVRIPTEKGWTMYAEGDMEAC